MIERLLSVEVNNFRPFSGYHQIPLDADVVVVHGNNACGKSSLLYAIEFALTGRVADLSVFDNDYPRCLRNAFSQGNNGTSVKCRMENGSEATFASTVEDSSSVQRTGELLPEAASQLFVERSYLSQVRLSRLLELYQSYEKGTTETPIVSFVKRLLQLDVFDNLTSALHHMEDLRRTRRAFPRFEDLEKLESRFPRQQQELSNNIKTAADSQAKRIEELKVLIELAGEAVRSDGWTVDSLKELELRLTEEQKNGSAEARLNRLEAFANQIRSIRASSTLLTGATEVELSRLNIAISQAGLQQAALADQVNPAIYGVIEDLKPFVPNLSLDQRPETFQESFVIAENAVRNQLAIMKALASSRRQQQKDVADLQLRLLHANQELKSLTQKLAETVMDLPEWADVLAEIARHLSGEECPVCQRDFSELRRGTLRDFLDSRIAELGVKAELVKQLSSQREAFEREVVDLNRNINATLTHLEQSDKRDNFDAEIAFMERCVARLEEIRPVLDQHTIVRSTLSRLQSELHTFQFQREQRSLSQIQIRQIADELAIQIPLNVEIQNSIDWLAESCERQIGKQRQRVSALRRAIDLLKEISDGFSKQASLDRQWLQLDLQGAKNNVLRAKVDIVMTSCRRLLRATNEAKRRLLEGVFDDQLNHLWTELFERLVRNEGFRPHLSEPITTRDKMRVAIQAVAENLEPFDNLGSIHSLGNLNTAALSLFLSLNLVEASNHRVLILDDPVQSMDDVHLAQLGLLCRELIYQAGRQIVVAVHERSLFDFLCFELSPKQAGRKLIAIDLSRSGDGRSSEAHIETKTWTPDEVQFVESDTVRFAS